MNPSIRAWLLLGVTLLLGICLGLLGGGALQERRVARVNDMRRPGGFTEHIQHVIQPTSDSQWARIRPLVEATAQQNMGMRHQHDSAMHAALDSLRATLDPLLDARQRERLAHFVPSPNGGARSRRGPRNDGPNARPSDDGREQRTRDDDRRRPPPRP